MREGSLCVSEVYQVYQGPQYQVYGPHYYIGSADYINQPCVCPALAYLHTCTPHTHIPYRTGYWVYGLDTHIEDAPNSSHPRFCVLCIWMRFRYCTVDAVLWIAIVLMLIRIRILPLVFTHVGKSEKVLKIWKFTVMPVTLFYLIYSILKFSGKKLKFSFTFGHLVEMDTDPDPPKKMPIRPDPDSQRVKFSVKPYRTD